MRRCVRACVLLAHTTANLGSTQLLARNTVVSFCSLPLSLVAYLVWKYLPTATACARLNFPSGLKGVDQAVGLFRPAGRALVCSRTQRTRALSLFYFLIFDTLLFFFVYSIDSAGLPQAAAGGQTCGPRPRRSTSPASPTSGPSSRW